MIIHWQTINLTILSLVMIVSNVVNVKHHVLYLMSINMKQTFHEVI